MQEQIQKIIEEFEKKFGFLAEEIDIATDDVGTKEFNNIKDFIIKAYQLGREDERKSLEVERQIGKIEGVIETLQANQ